MEVCAENAISVRRAGGKVLIDWDRCSACGECLSVCGSDVFQMKLVDKNRIFSTLKRSISEDGDAYFACKDRNDDKTAGVPTLAYIDKKMMVKTALMGANRIVLQTGDCEECRHARCYATSACEIKIAEEIFKAAGEAIQVTLAPYVKQKRSKAKKNIEDSAVVSRREFFSLVSKRTKQSVGEVVYSLSENDSSRRKTVLADKGNIKRTFTDDLKLLGGADLIEKMRSDGLLPGVQIDADRCVRCGVCARICAFGVYKAEYETVKGRKNITGITVDKDKCTGCGVCSITCMSKAITVQN